MICLFAGSGAYQGSSIGRYSTTTSSASWHRDERRSGMTNGQEDVFFCPLSLSTYFPHDGGSHESSSGPVSSILFGTSLSWVGQDYVARFAAESYGVTL